MKQIRSSLFPSQSLASPTNLLRMSGEEMDGTRVGSQRDVLRRRSDARELRAGGQDGRG